MLWTIFVILVVLWLLGFLGHVGGALIHLLLVIAVVVLIVNLIQGETIALNAGSVVGGQMKRTGERVQPTRTTRGRFLKHRGRFDSLLSVRSG